MKSHIILSSILFLLTSCGGNPHVHSSRGGLERTHPPLISPQEEEPGCRMARGLVGYEFFFSSHHEGDAGTYPARFLPFTKCKSLIKESFNSIPTGFSFLVTNSDREELSYELRHQAEMNYTHQKILYLEDIFSSETFTMEVESPVQQSGIKGKDQGVDSNNSTDDSRDALIWSFSSPVITFGVHVINLASSAEASARIRLFDCDRTLIKEMEVIYPGTEAGKSEKHFIGFIGGSGEVCHVALSSAGNLEAIAVDELIYGR